MNLLALKQLEIVRQVEQLPDSVIEQVKVYLDQLWRRHPPSARSLKGIWQHQGFEQIAEWVRFDNFSKVVKSVQRISSHPHCITTEILYLAEKHRIPITLPQTLDFIESSSKYELVNLNPAILRVAMEITFPELHDRLILATAKWLEIPIISSDQLFTGVPGISVLWD
jgi:hypothetical protein